MVSRRKPHSQKIDDGLDKIYASLRENNLKLTPTRKIIISALFSNHGPFSAEEIFQKFAKKVCDLGTVYRTLTSLEEMSMVRRCEFGDGIARYEFMNIDEDHHHHHLICKGCKKIEVVDVSSLEDSIEKFAKSSKFKSVSHILEFFGVCPDCQIL